VIIFANSTYTDNTFLTNLPQVKQDVKLTEDLFTKYKQFQFEKYENKTKIQMEDIINRKRNVQRAFKQV
jgi:hypothetical protein